MISSLVFYVIKLISVAIFAPLYTLRNLYNIYKNRGKSFEPVDGKPTCLQDLSLGKHGTIHLKKRGIDIHYVAKGDPSRPLMLFAHGFPEFWYSWRYQLREFGKDYYAVAFDMPGYGQSSKPKEMKRYERKELATDIKELILELGFSSCILVGHDWGAGISYEVAYYYPEVIDHVIILNCMYAGVFLKLVTFQQYLLSSYVYFFQVPFLAEYFLSKNECASLEFMRRGPMACKNKATFTKDDLLAYRYIFKKNGFSDPLKYYRCAMQPQLLFDCKREKIKVPGLILWGTADKAFDLKMAPRSAAEFEQCSLKYIEDASHWVQMDKPDEVNEAIREYLK